MIDARAHRESSIERKKFTRKKFTYRRIFSFTSNCSSRGGWGGVGRGGVYLGVYINDAIKRRKIGEVGASLSHRSRSPRGIGRGARRECR